MEPDMPRTLRLTRDLVNLLPTRVDERGPPGVESLPASDYHEKAAAKIMSERSSSGEMWVFAAGSLIWNPRCPVIERRHATIRGWRRSFCYGPDMRFRGSPDAPGLMMSLDHGDQCQGIVLRVSPDDLKDSLIYLLKQEPPFPIEWVEAETKNGKVAAIAFTAYREFVRYQPEPPVEEVADVLASSVGHFGSMADYLLNTVIHLEKAGIHDPHLWRLQELVAARLERLR
jgi:cation transport protein ChaC